MTATAQLLLKNALQLSTLEREEVAEALFESCHPPEPGDLDPELLEELERRSAEIDSGTAEFSSWPEVRQRVLAKLGM